MENLDVNVQPELRKAARRGRAARQSTPSVIVSPRTRKVPAYALLSEDALQAIEHQADWILEHIGIEFRGDIAGELEMLFLVLADGNVGGVI